jgi:hypothetical protein
MKFAVLTMFFFFSSLALAHDPGVQRPQQPTQQGPQEDYYGTWIYETESNGISIKVYMTLAADSVSVRNECSWGGLFGVHLTVENSVPVTILPDGTRYAPQKKAGKAVRYGDNTYRCNADINENTNPKSGAYRIVGDLMYFFDDNGQAVRDSAGSDLVFRRVR